MALGKRLGFSVPPFLSHQMEVLSTSQSTDNTDRNPPPGACHPDVLRVAVATITTQDCRSPQCTGAPGMKGGV